MRQAPARVSRQRTHSTFFSFSLPPDITTPIRTSHGVPQKVEAARKNTCCEEVYAGTVLKHKSRACGNLQRIRLLSRGESQQTIDYSQLRSSARRGSLAETPRKRRRFHCQPAVTGIASKTRHRSGFAVREISAAHLLQHHRVRIHWPESGH